MKLLNIQKTEKASPEVLKIIETNSSKNILLCRDNMDTLAIEFENVYYAYCPDKENIHHVIEDAKNYDFDMIIFYRRDLNWDDIKNFTDIEADVEFIITSVCE